MNENVKGIQEPVGFKVEIGDNGNGIALALQKIINGVIAVHGNIDGNCRLGPKDGNKKKPEDANEYK